MFESRGFINTFKALIPTLIINTTCHSSYSLRMIIFLLQKGLNDENLGLYRLRFNL